MNGSVELFKACKKHGVKPMLGLEAYFVDDRSVPRGARSSATTSRCWRATTRASRNLTKLSSAGFLEGLHRGKPGVDLELLAALRRRRDRALGLPGLARLAGASSRAASPMRARTSTTSSRPSAPRTSTSRSSATASPSRSRSTRRSSASRARWAGRSSRTADVHYLRREDYHHHAALLCVQTKSTLAQPKMSFDANEFYLKSSEEMAASFADLPEALASTLEIAERCNVSARARRAADPALRHAGRRAGARLPARARRGRPARAATAIPCRRPRVERADMELARHRPHGLQRLLPDRLGLRRTTRSRTGSRSARAAARRPARSSPTACRSPTSTRCATTCCSSASSTPSACPCRTSTSTSPCAAASA